MTLVAFLEARLADDEAAALAATPDGWHHSDAHGSSVVTADRQSMVADFSPEGDAWRGLWSYAAHMARHDPARVLAEVAAKRAVLTLGGSECSGYEDGPVESGVEGLGPWRHYPDPDFDGHCEGCEAAMASDDTWTLAVRHLAAVYSDHPDYDESWAVS